MGEAATANRPPRICNCQYVYLYPCVIVPHRRVTITGTRRSPPHHTALSARDTPLASRLSPLRYRTPPIQTSHLAPGPRGQRQRRRQGLHVDARATTPTVSREPWFARATRREARPRALWCAWRASMTALTRVGTVRTGVRTRLQRVGGVSDIRESRRGSYA